MFFRPTSRTCALAHHGYITSMVNGLITLMTPSTRPHPWTTDYLSLPWTGRDSNHGPIGPESYTLPVRHNLTHKRVDIHRLVDCPHTTPAAVNCFRAPVICFNRGWLRSEWHWLYRYEYMFFRPTSRTCALTHHGYTTSMVKGS